MSSDYIPYEPSPPPVRERLPQFSRVCWCGGSVRATKQIHPEHGYRYRLHCWNDIKHDPLNAPTEVSDVK